jgi:hypothetical protein
LTNSAPLLHVKIARGVSLSGLTPATYLGCFSLYDMCK